MSNTIKVCTIGGGSGMPVINMAFIKAGFCNIRSIVTTFDSGGYTGRMKTDERGNLLAFSDYWRSLISLWDDGEQKEIWEEMLRYRDGRGRNFGDNFFQFMAEKTGDLSKVDTLFCSLTGAKLKGEVMPVSKEPSDIYFKTISGKTYKGEHQLDELRMSSDRVDDIWLQPLVKASSEALQAIEEADLIVFCPGSIYGSILVNFLPDGMKEAYKKSKAKKMLIANLVSSANETDGINLKKYNELFEKYLNNGDFDIVVEPDFGKIDKDLLEKVKQNYAYENSYLYESCVVSHDIVTVEKNNCRLRHSIDKLADLFKKILVE
jgi:uncharacterized cofD-like protein